MSTATAAAPRAAAEDAADQLARWGDDPVAFVLDNFGPGYEARHNAPLVPDPWQVEAMRAVAAGDWVRFAFAASKNALKTCTLAWLILWWLTTRPSAQIVCVSVTGAQLKSGLWKELATWFGLSPLLQATFHMSAEQICSRDPRHKLTWWCQARSFPQDADAAEQKESLAGLHGPAMMFVGDEASGLPDGVVAAADAIFASEGGEARLLLAGNTIRRSGPLYRAVMNRDNLWWVKRISGDPDDPQRCTRVSIKWANEQLAQCDGDKKHPHYMVNVLGEFPEVDSLKLLGPDQVDKAMRRSPKPADFESEPIIVGIDTALHGSDQTALIKRQGCVAFRPRCWRTTDSMVLADQIAGELVRLKPDAVFVDLGGPSGYAIRDRLNQLNFKVVGIDFGAAAIQDNPAAPVFANRRAEMAWKCADWVKSAGSLPSDQELRAELLEPNFWPAAAGKTRFLVEPKDEIKARLNGRSPDKCDALWLTFAAPVVAKRREDTPKPRRAEPDPYDVMGGRA